MKDFAEGFWKATPPGRLLMISIALTLLSCLSAFVRHVWVSREISNISEVVPRLDARIAALDVSAVWFATTLMAFAVMLVVCGIWAIILYRKQ